MSLSILILYFLVHISLKETLNGGQCLNQTSVILECLLLSLIMYSLCGIPSGGKVMLLIITSSDIADFTKLITLSYRFCINSSLVVHLKASSYTLGECSYVYEIN
jgi:hypothetical protein